MKYSIQTEQSFSVTYTLDATSPEEAWDKLIEGEGYPVIGDQIPGDIIGTFTNASIEEED